MKKLCLISFVLALFCLTAPVMTWPDSCPEGQTWNDRQGECVKGKTSSSKEKKSITNKNPAEVEKWKFGGAKWFATTTGGVEDSIMGHGDEVKFVLHTDRCIRNPAALVSKMMVLLENLGILQMELVRTFLNLNLQIRFLHLSFTLIPIREN